MQPFYVNLFSDDKTVSINKAFELSKTLAQQGKKVVLATDYPTTTNNTMLEQAQEQALFLENIKGTDIVITSAPVLLHTARGKVDTVSSHILLEQQKNTSSFNLFVPSQGDSKIPSFLRNNNIKHGFLSKNFNEKSACSAIMKALQGLEKQNERKNEPIYNLDDFSRIPMKDVLDHYNIPYNKGDFFKLRNEKTASTKIYHNKNGDFFQDMGDTSLKGNNLNLVQYINDYTFKEALNELASTFNISPLNNVERKAVITMSNDEYQAIDVFPHRVVANFNTDFEKIAIDNMEQLGEKFSMDMQTLRKKSPTAHDKVISRKGIPFVEELQRDYYKACFVQYKVYTDAGLDPIVDGMGDTYDNLNNFASLIQSRQKTLNKAFVDKSKNTLEKAEFMPSVDIANITLGLQPVELGRTTAKGVKEIATKRNEPLLTAEVNGKALLENFNSLEKVKAREIPYSMELNTKKDTAKLSYLKGNESFIKDTFHMFFDKEKKQRKEIEQ